MIHEKSCGALVVRRGKDGKRYILMIRQRRGGNRSFPKGHDEVGETELMTAEREVFEETSVRIKITSAFRKTVNYQPAPGVDKEVVYFLAFTDCEATSARKGEIADVEWVRLDHAEKYLVHENDRIVLRAALLTPELAGQKY